MKTRTMPVVLIAEVIACSVPGMTANAQGPPPDTGRRAELIRKYDRDGDGKLSDAEIEAARPKEGPRGPREVDGDGPQQGRSTPCGNGELKHDGQMQALLEEFDSDGNGTLGIDEMAALRNALRNRSGTRTQDAGTPGYRHGKERDSNDKSGPEPTRAVGQMKDFTQRVSAVSGQDERKHP